MNIVEQNACAITGTSCQGLMELNPSRSGLGMKKTNSMLAYWFPWFFTQWKSRYFVLLGNFLYRFESETGTSLKGVPIPIDSITVKRLGRGILELDTIRKIYIIQFSSEEESTSWVNSLKIRKLESIRELMGHAKIDKELKQANLMGNRLLNQRLEKDRRETANTYNPLSSLFVPN